jgi:L-asparaginase II
VALAKAMLDRVGLDEGDLACGVHEPLSRRGAALAHRSGTPLTRLHNNCSGKHAAMLALSVREGWPLLGYERAEHPTQRAALAAVAVWTGVPATGIEQGVDGCGVVTFGLPLHAMARSFARLAEAARRGDEVPRRIVGAMRTRPFLVGGTDRFDTVLAEETGGRVVAKVGAEGVHTVAVLEAGIGLAVKAEDGAARAQHPAVLRLLQHVGALPDPLPPRLAPWLRSAVLNTRGEAVGAIAPVA